MFKWSIVMFSLYLIAACGGGGGSTASAGQNNSTATPTPTPEPVVILDNFDALDGPDEIGNVYAAPSTINGIQHAMHFSLSDSMTITKVSWVGTGNITSSSATTSVTVILRVMDESGSSKTPDSSTAQDVVVTALVETTAIDIFTFVAEDDSLFHLEPGDYFLSVLDPETEGTEFRWIEKSDDPGIIAVFRTGPEAGWISWESARNLRVEGVIQ